MNTEDLLRHQLAACQLLLKEEHEARQALLTEINGPRGWRVGALHMSKWAGLLVKAGQELVAAEADMATAEDWQSPAKVARVSSAWKHLSEAIEWGSKPIISRTVPPEVPPAVPPVTP